MISLAPERVSVSVALCTHNGERFIAEQLASILGQSVVPDEVVLSDDASSDATVAVATGLLQQHRAAHEAFSFTVLRNDSALGVANNFAQAIERCASSDLVILCDQDDVWRRDRVAEIVKTFTRRPEVVLLHSDARLVDAGGAPLGLTLFEALGVSDWERRTETKGDALKVFVKRNLVTGATTAFRSSLIAHALPIPAGWIHDEWFAMVAAAVGRVDLDPRPLVDYRQHGGNQIGAAKLSLRGKLGKLREPRTERNRNLFIRARELVTRLEQMNGLVDARTKRVAWAKQEHERFRSALPTNRAKRVFPVLASVARGNYGRYGMGAQDVLRDLLQPVD